MGPTYQSVVFLKGKDPVLAADIEGGSGMGCLFISEAHSLDQTLRRAMCLYHRALDQKCVSSSLRDITAIRLDGKEYDERAFLRVNKKALKDAGGDTFVDLEDAMNFQYTAVTFTKGADDVLTVLVHASASLPTSTKRSETYHLCTDIGAAIDVYEHAIKKHNISTPLRKLTGMRVNGQDYDQSTYARLVKQVKKEIKAENKNRIEEFKRHARKGRKIPSHSAHTPMVRKRQKTPGRRPSR